MDRLPSERIVVQSPLSYAGSARRLWRMTWADNRWVRWLALVPAALLLTAAAWAAVTAWYLLFGVLVVPWRLLRRGARRRKVEAARHRELMSR